MDSTHRLSFSEILTCRLFLRQLRASDAAAIFALQSNEQNRKYLERPPMGTLGEASQFINKMNKGITGDEWLYWGICLKDSEEIIGTICLWHFSKKPYKADVGYELHPDHQGKGIMNEALTAVMDYGFRVLELDYIDACTSQHNLHSIRLLKKNRFSFVRELSKEEVLAHEKELGLCLYRHIPK